VADYHPCEAVAAQDDGSLVVSLRARDTAWVRRLALRLGEQGQVLAPTELADAVRGDARRALAAYET
jgi:proteasome accessory factor C